MLIAPTLSLPLLLLIRRIVPRVIRRVEVTGDSMRPTLVPGDRVVVLGCRRARPGAVVVVDGSGVGRPTMIKRVSGVGPAGISVLGDNPAASTDSRYFDAVPRISGRVVYRYHPAGRTGRVR